MTMGFFRERFDGVISYFIGISTGYILKASFCGSLRDFLRGQMNFLYNDSIISRLTCCMSETRADG
jgi:hypothetical protein